MAEGGTHTFSDPDGYATAFGDVRIKLTITGAGDFSARLTRLRLPHLEVYRCRESLPRIAYISLPAERIVLSFPIGSASPLFGGFALRNGDIVVHGRGERMHQRSNGACQWGLVSLSAKRLADCGEALNGRPVALPQVNRVLRPTRAEALRFQHLFGQACRLADGGNGSIERSEVAGGLEQEMFDAVVHCLSAEDASDLDKTKHHHAEVLVRFEEALTKNIGHKLKLAALSEEVGVAERTLRMCCSEVLGVSPTRYLLLQRLNSARSALRRANPSIASVAEIARDNQFLEFGRFAVTYRTVFGESPSTTLQRNSPE
jgi:AraC-like DNA-binding protein